MTELTKSTLRYSWALSMLGLQETMSALSGPSKAAEQPAGAATEAAGGIASPEDQLRDLYKAAFEAGEKVQNDFVDSVAHYLSPAVLYDPATALRLGTELVWDMTDAMRFFWPESKTLTAWRELRNKVDVYQLVRAVEKKLRLPREGEFKLAEYVDKAYALGPYAALWAVEGLGHDYADSVRERGGELEGLLQGERIADLPSRSLLMLHAGIGLSFAQRLMEHMNAKTPEADLHAALAEFIRLCEVNSEPGYTGAALESLGLVTRTFHSELVPAVDQYLGMKNPQVQGFFWHGVGRAIYFLLVNFLPYKDPVWRAVEMGRHEAPHDLARNNVLAGTAWALTLVNMRQPEVMAAFLEDHGAEITPLRDAFANGVTSSVVMRFDTSPDDPNIENFRAYKPSSGERRLTDYWEKLIHTSLDLAIDRYYPVLRKRRKLDGVFRYQSLEALVKG